MREPALIVLKLSPTQYAHVVNSMPNGGQLSLKNQLLGKARQIEGGGFEIALTECELGKLMHQMAYGGGGWQNALTRAFRMPIEKYCGWL